MRRLFIKLYVSCCQIILLLFTCQADSIDLHRCCVSEVDRFVWNNWSCPNARGLVAVYALNINFW